jgi:transposase-like protein
MANTAALEHYNVAHAVGIEIHRVKSLNEIMEQDHRGIKGVTRPVLGFTLFEAKAKETRRVQPNSSMRWRNKPRKTGFSSFIYWDGQGAGLPGKEYPTMECSLGQRE